MNTVYVANADGQDISVFHLAGDGSLKAQRTLTVQSPPQTGRSMLLALSPDERYLYAAYLSGGTHFAVSTFLIAGPEAMPVHLGSAALEDSMAYMISDRSGRFLLCASYAGDRVTVNSIRPDGQVGALAQNLPTAPKAHCIVTDSSNRHVLHTSLGGDLVYQQRFDAHSGVLSPNAPASIDMTPGSGPRFIAVSPDDRFVYINAELDGSIAVHPFDGHRGTLGPRIQQVSVLPPGFTGKIWAADLRLSPDGRHLYASERTSSTLCVFAVDRSSGMLRALGSVKSVRQPRAIAIDPTGRYLLAAGQLSNSVMSYALDCETGMLTALQEYPVGRNPTWIEITGRGFAAAGNIAAPMRP